MFALLRPLVPPDLLEQADEAGPFGAKGLGEITMLPTGAALANAVAEDHFQFERHGYFVADLVDHNPGRLVFNRTVTLRDSWSKKPG